MEDGAKLYISNNDYYKNILDNSKIYYEIRKEDEIVEYSDRYFISFRLC